MPESMPLPQVTVVHYGNELGDPMSLSHFCLYETSTGLKNKAPVPHLIFMVLSDLVSSLFSDSDSSYYFLNALNASTNNILKHPNLSVYTITGIHI